MKIKDLGALSGPVLAFGGPYSNLHATRALIKAASDHGIPPARCICTGDVVAYAAHPSETADAIIDFGCAVVAGNMEQQLGAGAQDCGCGFEDGTACDLMSGAWYTHAGAHVSPAQRAWMAACADVITFQQDGVRVAVIHGGVTDVALFVWPNSPEVVFQREWDALEQVVGPVDVVISGHCGLAFEKQMPRGLWLNAGVIGMPGHDGTPQTRYAIVEAGRARVHPLAYDQDAACAAMEAAGLTQGYHRALVTGYWPSEDILPSELRLASRASG